MPQIAGCPDCGSKLKVPDAMLGKKVKCPRCSTTFIIAPPPEEDMGAVAQEPIARKRRPPTPVPDDDPDDRPSRRRRDDDDEDRPRRRKVSRGAGGEWGKVRTGLLFAILGFGMYAVGWLVLGCAGMSLFAGAASAMNQQGQPGQPPNPNGLMAGLAGGVILAVLSAIATFAGRALEITAFIFCLYAPSKYGAKGLAIATLILAGLGLMASCGGLIPMGAAAGVNAANPNFGGNPGFPNNPGFPPPPPPRNPTPAFLGGNPIGSVGPLFYFIQVIVFLFFLRSVALACREDGLARSIVGLIILIGVTCLVACLSICGMVMAAFGFAASAASQAAKNQQMGGPPPDPSNLFAAMGAVGIIGIIVMVILALLFLAALIWYFVTLFQVRTAVANHMDGRG
jgi:predicted Zn finger-like uncharacterized protein